MDYCSGYHSGGYRFDVDRKEWVCVSCDLPTKKHHQTIIEFSSDKEHKFVAAKKFADVATFIYALQGFLVEFAAEYGIPPFDPSEVATPARAKKAAASSAVESDDDDDDADDDSRRAEYNAMSIAALRKAVIKAGYEPDDVATAKKVDLVNTLMSEGAEEEPADDDADDEEEETLTRADLEGLGLRELQRVAREKYGYARKDYAGMDTDTLITFLLGSEDEGEGDDDEPDEDDDEDGYTEEDLMEMSPAELRAIAKENGVKLKVGLSKAAMVKALIG